MNIKNTRILHRRYTQQGWLTRTLRQGEIGILLSDDGKSVLQVRIGVSNGPDGLGGTFSEGVLLGLEAQNLETTKQYPTRLDFPATGSEFVCYFAQDTNSIWRWDNKSTTYIVCSSGVIPGEGNGWWQEINGGGASLYDKNGHLTLGTTVEKGWWLPEYIATDNN